MSHYMSHVTVNKENEIQKEAKNFAKRYCDRYENPDGVYHGNLTIQKSTVYDSIESADEYLNRYYYAKGDYYDCAVPYKDLDSVKPPKKMTEIKQRISENRKQKERYISENKVQNRTSKSITCTCCGSRLNLSYLDGQKCPLCGTDLRSPTVQNRIKKFDKDYDKLQRELEKEKRKLIQKAPVKWRIKLEIHC